MKVKLFSIMLVPVIFLFLIGADVFSAEYVGSQTCGNCHASKYQSWLQTGHYKKVCEMTDDNVLCDADSNGTNDFKDGLALDGTHGFDSKWAQFTTAGGATGDYAPVLGYDGSNYTITIGDRTFNIVYCLGCSNIWKQRYMVQMGNSYYILPIQYNVDTKEWVVYHAENWYTWDDADGDGKIDSDEQITGVLYGPGDTPVSLGRTNDSWQRRCMGCHTTGLITVEQNEDGEWLGEEGVQFKEFNIGCEACHGPGSEHVAGGGDKSKIINPEDLEYERRVEVCGRCHSRGTSTDGIHGYPWNDQENKGFTPGDILSQFYREKGGYWPNGYSKKHHQQFIDFRKSPHWAAIDCVSCHDPHGSDYEYLLVADPEDNSLCNMCHWYATGTVLTNHTHHPPVEESPSSRCTKCHMPKIAKSAYNYDIHSHVFKPLEPNLTLEYEMPNSCAAECHRDNEYGEGAADENLSDWGEDSDVTIANWAQEYWEEWFEAETELKIGADQHVYHPNDDMIVFISGKNKGQTIMANLYIALEVGGSFFFFPTWSSEPYALPIAIVSGLRLPPTPFLYLPMSSAIPDGTYNWYLVAIDYSGQVVGDVSIAPWTFASSKTYNDGEYNFIDFLENAQVIK